MRIGTVELDSRGAALAPMAGVADLAFREICAGYGAAYTVGEMVSCKGLTMHDRKSRQLLEISDVQRPAAVQLFGDNPEIMARAARLCLEFKPEVIDINMGCPAPKIAGNGGGSALMKNPELATSIVRAVADAVSVPVTVKIRTGWDSDSINAPLLASEFEQAGAAAITVHGRTKAQMYAPPVDYETIAAVKRAVSIPVIANGDITGGISAAEMIERTNCDMVMIGRGALGRPWVFAAVSSYLKYGRILPEPPISECMRVMLCHIESICRHKGDRIGMREARKHAAWYIRDIHSAAKYRQEVCTLESLEQLQELAFRIAAENS